MFWTKDELLSLTPKKNAISDSRWAHSWSNGLLRLLTRVSSGQDAAGRAQASAAEFGGGNGFFRRGRLSQRRLSFALSSDAAPTLLSDASSALLRHPTLLHFPAAAPEILRGRALVQFRVSGGR